MPNKILLKQKETTTTLLANLDNREMLVNNADIQAFIRIADRLKQFLFDDDLRGGADSFSDRINTISTFVSPNAGGIVSGYYYDNNPHCGVGTLIGAANRIDLAPYYTSETFSINQIGCAVATAVAGSLFKVVIYASDADGWPGAKLYESGDLSGAAVAYVSENLAFEFKSGTKYWLGVRHSSTCTLRTVLVANTYNLGLGSSGAATVQATIVRRTIAYATPAPASWSFVKTDLVSNTTPPSVRFRAV